MVIVRELFLQGLPLIVNVLGFNRPVAAGEIHFVFQTVRFSQFKGVLHPPVAPDITCGKAFHRITSDASIGQIDSAVAHIPYQRDLNGRHG